MEGFSPLSPRSSDDEVAESSRRAVRVPTTQMHIVEDVLAEEGEEAEGLPTIVWYMLIVILLNMLEAGAQEQWKVVKYPELQPVYFWLDACFVIPYLVEAGVLLRQLGWSYFTNGWNILSTVLTLAAMVDVLSQTNMTMDDELAGSLRKVRVLRFVRVFRVFRVLKQVPDLQMVVGGLQRSLESIFWVLSLMGILIYAFAIFFTLMIDETLYPKEFQDFEYFSDLSHSILTLCDIAILAEWGEIVRPVLMCQPWLLVFFSIFVLLTAFGMLNVMIGVIVDSTSTARQALVFEEKKKHIDIASNIWREMIHSKGLSLQDIEKSTDRARKHEERELAIYQILEKLLEHQELINFPSGLQPDDIMHLLDFDASGELTHDEFKTGLERLLCGDEFQLTCLTLTVLGKVRKERTDGQRAVEAKLGNVEKGQRSLQEQMRLMVEGQEEIRRQLAELARGQKT